MRLSYEISVDSRQLKSSLRGIEGEVTRTARAANRRVASPAAARARAPKAAADGEQRAAQQAEGYWKRAHQRATDFRIRQDEKAHRARERQVAKEEATQTRAQRRIETERRRTIASVRGGAARSVAGGLGAAARLGAAGLGVAGGFAAAGALSETFDIKRRASQLAISAGDPQQKHALEREALGVRGFSGSETLGALQGFVEKTGNLGAGRALIKDLGELALATSTDFDEMGSAAGQAFNVIRDTITDPKKQLEAVNDVMATLAGQGNLGAVEIKDMVTELAGLGAATRKFEGGPVALLKTAGAMAQASVARGGAASAPEATTAVTRFAQDIVQNEKQFSSQGIDVFSDKSRTKLRGPDDIMLDVLEKTGGDLKKINAMFGVYAERAVGGFSPLFVEAERKEKGSGKAAVKAEYDRFVKAGLTPGQRKERAESRLEDPDIQMKEAAKVFNQAVGQDLAPVAVQLAKKFAELAPQIGGIAKALAKFVGFLVENPFAGVGLIVGGSIAKDIGKAGIANMISGEIKGKLGAALNGLGAGLSVATMIVTASVLNFEKRTANIEAGGKRVLDAEEAAKAGDVAGVQRILGEQKKATTESTKEGFVESLLKSFFNFGVIDIGTEEQKKKRQAAVASASQVLDSERPVEQKSQEAFEASIQKMATEVEQVAARMAKVDPSGSGGPKDPVRNTPNNKR